MDDHDREHLAVTRIILRPTGTPLPLGFIGLVVATTAFACLQLGWLPADQHRQVALGALVFTVPVQLIAAVFGFLARDPVAGTGMGVLAGAWATAGAVTLTSPAGTTSSGLGVVLLAGAAALLVPTVAATGKLVAAAVMGLSALRFAVTGIAEITAAPDWSTAAGWCGLVLAVVALYAAAGFELEDVHRRTVLPLLRVGSGRSMLNDPIAGQLRGVAREAGVREQL
ncbi:hypothetical protein [Plantactinospora sp. KLBMP9567]|uniref:hypothetical protein n=1 Tax=Plantactinospora sp. KLBMP9567 TaxID=3085900 RepID=UPI002981E41B|nr:hypothetical protein [Plantactinospora sp. KLBMP9567]MDW5328877.1 hypothetical protein [Plantactinospora sp. KLBMP9567]